MSNPNPTVSVVIPCFNSAPFLRETVESVLSQTYHPLEVLVVDDGSTDESAAIAESFGSPVRVIRQANQGESVARNRGMDEASGDWIAFLDADDVWRTNKLECQVKMAVTRPEVVCIHTGIYRFGLVNEVLVDPSWEAREHLAVDDLILHARVLAMSALVKVTSPVRFPTWTKHGEDLIFFAELSLHGGFAYVAEDLVGYRMHSTQQTKNIDHVVEIAKSRFRWLEGKVKELGADRVRRLKRAILDQLVEAATIEYWRRDWPRFRALREFLSSNEWYGVRPAVLDRTIYPNWCYQLKDRIDRMGTGAGRLRLTAP